MAAPARRVSARLSAIAPSATLAVDARAKELKAAVSYTHLTLPTILLV